MSHLDATDWMIQASCRLDSAWTTVQDVGHNGREREVTPNRFVLAHLAAICSFCPVIADCARYALKHDCDGGMYAGVWLPTSGRHHSGHRADPGMRFEDARDALRRAAATGQVA